MILLGSRTRSLLPNIDKVIEGWPISTKLSVYIAWKLKKFGTA